MRRTKCPKIYHKSILHLFKYNANLYKAVAVQIFRKFGTLSISSNLRNQLVFKEGEEKITKIVK